MPRYVVSADIGQLHDFTAISVCEVWNRQAAWEHVLAHPDEHPPMLTLDPAIDFDAKGSGALVDSGGCARLNVRHMERLRQQSYPQIIRRIAELMRKPPLGNATLLIDATGVGRPVLDMARAAGLWCTGMTITSGRDEAHHPADYRDWLVPKRLLIQTVDMLLHRDALKVAPTLAEAENLVYELNDFRYRIDPETGYESCSARSSEHDDMVLSIAMACWHATQPERGDVWTTYVV